MEEEQHHWDDRRRMPDGGYPHGPPGPLGLLGVRPGMPPQPQGPAVSVHIIYLGDKSVKIDSALEDNILGKLILRFNSLIMSV